MNSDKQNYLSWWGKFKFHEGYTAHWRIGPLSLWFQRLQNEWRIAYLQIDISDEMATEVNLPVSPDEISADATHERYVFRNTKELLNILPALADRPVVTCPATPFFLPSGEEINIFVSSPLWIRIEVHEEGQLLLEMPIYRPSDTWFGPSTREGELCYASQTNCRLHPDELSFRPHRAITPVMVKNKAETSLLIERISLPVNYLSLFHASSGQLWTQTITMERKEEENVATMQLAKGPPSQAGRAALVHGPRLKSDKRVLMRALTALFG